MHRRTRRGNRLGLTVIGVLTTLAGVAVLLAHFGALGPRAKTSNILPGQAADWLVGHRWAFWILGVVGLVVALIALRWLLVQLRTDRVSSLSIDSDRSGDTDAGRTVLQGGALLDAVDADIDAIPGVQKASAVLSGSRDAPELWLTVTLHENSDSGAVRAALVEKVLPDVRTFLEQPRMPAYLTLKVSSHESARQVN